MSGEPSYIELGVRDPGRARAFYGRLLGWEVSERGEVRTSTLSIGTHGGDDASLFEVFFAVPSLDSALERVRELGGAAVGDVQASEGLGRWAECTDDQGVRFGLVERV